MTYLFFQISSSIIERCSNEYNTVIKYIIILYNIGSRQCTKRDIVEERDMVDIIPLAKTKGTLINIIQSLKYISNVPSRKCTMGTVVEKRDIIDVIILVKTKVL